MSSIEEKRKQMIAVEKMLCEFKKAINELGFDFGCSEVKPIAAQPEKPARKIDAVDWYFEDVDHDWEVLERLICKASKIITDAGFGCDIER